MSVSGRGAALPSSLFKQNHDDFLLIIGIYGHGTCNLSIFYTAPGHRKCHVVRIKGGVSVHSRGRASTGIEIALCMDKHSKIAR